MEKNEAAAALARRGVKKHPHLHSKERMQELVKIRKQKKAAGEEPALVKEQNRSVKPKKVKEVKKGELPDDMKALADRLAARAKENKDDIPYS